MRALMSFVGGLIRPLVALIGDLFLDTLELLWNTVSTRKHGMSGVLFFGGLIGFTIGFQLESSDFAFQVVEYSIIAVLIGFFIFVFKKTQT